MTITLILNAEQEEKLNCILSSQEEETSTQELIQALFDEALTANYLFYGKCTDVTAMEEPGQGEAITEECGDLSSHALTINTDAGGAGHSHRRRLFALTGDLLRQTKERTPHDGKGL